MNAFMKGLVVARARRGWFLARWLVVGAALPLVWACNPRTVVAPTSHPDMTVIDEFPSSLAPKLDVLFMVDDSPSMKPLQQELIKEFPTFMEPLKKVRTADGFGTALPDIHVAVVSSDTGSAGAPPTTFCNGKGDDGKFQFLPRGTCTASPFHQTPTQQTFLSASANQTITNFDGDISDAFACIAQLGDKGCGFEGQLKSVRWALDPSNLPDGNQGFLRDDAFLAVVLITNEDDCSVPDDSDLADPNQTLMSDPLGPYWSYRCNEFGHLCNINGALQPPPRGAADNLQGCVSNETSTSMLTRVADEVAFLKGLKRDPSQIVVAAITGLPRTYGVEMIQASTDSEPHPNIKHSCVSTTDSTINADPAVRLQQWVKSFDHGIIENICADTLNPALDRIATLVALQLGPQCVNGTLQDKDPSTTQLDPECQVMDSYVDAEKHARQTALPACAVDPTPPCWTLVDDAARCAAGKRLQVTRDGGTLPDGMHTSISCTLCVPGVVAPGCP